MRSGGQAPQQQPAVGEAVVRFQVLDWMLEDGQVICVTGSIPQLGMWQQDQMLLLTGALLRWQLNTAAGCDLYGAVEGCRLVWWMSLLAHACVMGWLASEGF
jgi:hypothetical protein